MEEYPITILASDGSVIDRAANVESTVSVLYGDLSYHEGSARTILCPAEYVSRLRYEARINADCWGIPLDMVKAVEAGTPLDKDEWPYLDYVGIPMENNNE